MKAASLMLALTSLALVVSSCGDDDGGSRGDGGTNINADAAVMVDGEPAGLSGITSAHNQVRAGVSPAPSTPLPPLTWSNTVASAAQTWANNCEFEHGGPGNYGQNIFATTGGAGGPAVTQSWASEVAHYDYDMNKCQSGKVCGHYTQVVWRNSTELGCGVAQCNTGSPWGSGSWTLVVCNYNPPGNYVGQKPY